MQGGLSVRGEPAAPAHPCELSGNDGAQGRDRTADTAIFSRMLYQLSYLGVSGEARKQGL